MPVAQMVNSHFDGSQNQRLLQHEMERLHTASSTHLNDALSALTFSFASPETVRDVGKMAESSRGSGLCSCLDQGCSITGGATKGSDPEAGVVAQARVLTPVLQWDAC